MQTAESYKSNTAPDSTTGERRVGTAAWRKIVMRYQQPSRWRAIWQIFNTLVPFVGLWCLMYWPYGESHAGRQSGVDIPVCPANASPKDRPSGVVSGRGSASRRVGRVGIDAGGIAGGSRWLSGATPPEFPRPHHCTPARCQRCGCVWWWRAAFAGRTWRLGVMVGSLVAGALALRGQHAGGLVCEAVGQKGVLRPARLGRDASPYPRGAAIPLDASLCACKAKSLQFV